MCVECGCGEVDETEAQRQPSVMEAAPAGAEMPSPDE